MSRLQDIRQQQHLTQEELFERSGISVRTIQRIEAGDNPKGYTLKTLAKALGVAESDLLELPTAIAPVEVGWLKLINFSALPFMFAPPLNIIVPLVIMYAKKEFTPLTRRLVTIQIIWALLTVVLFLLVLILNDWFAIRSKFMMLVPVFWLAVNTFIILRNAVSIAKDQTLRLSPDFSII